MTGAPLVDVVIPVYNRAGPVVEAIESVLSQDGPSFHVHVVDDGSTDDTAAAVQAVADRDPRVSLHQQPNRGVSAARNRGIGACSGRLITFLDSDDLMTPGRLAFQVDVVSDPLMGDAVVGTERIEVAPGVDPPVILKAQLAQSGPKRYWQSVMTTLAAIEAVGGYDESLDFAEDLDLALRLRRNGLRVEYVDRELVIRRINGDNLSYQGGDLADVLLSLFRTRST